MLDLMRDPATRTLLSQSISGVIIIIEPSWVGQEAQTHPSFSRVPWPALLPTCQCWFQLFCEYIHMCLEDQGLMSCVFLLFSLPSLLKQALSLVLEITDLAK